MGRNPYSDAARDDHFMAEALALGGRAKGRTAPNPAVGAVIVRDGEVVGRGYHERAGGPHAEVVALRDAGERARGGTLYVTLEPCAGAGRTPACAPAVLKAAPARVVIGTLDPHPATAGRGAAMLHEGGAAVKAGVLEQACRHLIEDFAKTVATGRPWVTAKYAMTLDGKTATRIGESAWITGEAARAYAHELRWEHNAVVVGKGTVVADDPRLTVRSPGRTAGAGPIRVVVASDAELPVKARVFEGIPRPPVWVACATDAPRRNIRRLAARGAEVIVCRAKRGLVSIPALLDEFGARGVTSVLVEGGETLLGSFFDEDAVDRVTACIAPLIVGGRRAKPAVGGAGVAAMSEARVLREVRRRRFGPDMVIEGYLSDVNEYFARVAEATRAWKRAAPGRPGAPA